MFKDVVKQINLSLKKIIYNNR